MILLSSDISIFFYIEVYGKIKFWELQEIQFNLFRYKKEVLIKNY